MTQNAPAAPSFLAKLLSEPRLARIRRNHGLEHAVIHVLSARFPHTGLAGHSTAFGFRLVGDVETAAVQQAVEEALSRLRAGEGGLTVHPFCGTNFATAGLFAGLFAGLSMWLTERRSQDLFERLALAISSATLGVMLGFPLGVRLQANVTTSAEVQNLRLVEIRCETYGDVTVHYIRTES